MTTLSRWCIGLTHNLNGIFWQVLSVQSLMQLEKFSSVFSRITFSFSSSNWLYSMGFRGWMLLSLLLCNNLLLRELYQHPTTNCTSHLTLSFSSKHDLVLKCPEQQHYYITVIMKRKKKKSNNKTQNTCTCCCWWSSFSLENDERRWGGISSCGGGGRRWCKI